MHFCSITQRMMLWQLKLTGGGVNLAGADGEEHNQDEKPR